MLPSLQTTQCSGTCWLVLVLSSYQLGWKQHITNGVMYQFISTLQSDESCSSNVQFSFTVFGIFISKKVYRESVSVIMLSPVF